METRKWNTSIIFFSSFLIVVISQSTSPKRSQAAQTYRLPDNVVPKRYNLEILTNLDENEFNFDGKVLIQINCIKAGNKLTLHSKGLRIIEKDVNLKQLTTNTSINIPITSHTYVEENDFYVIMLGQPLVPGNTYDLYIQFKGNLTEGLVGYYRSSYIDRATNKTKWLAVTQFEPSDARRAFPCFDEPAMKATFAISLGQRKHLKAISNMPVKATENIKNKPDWEIHRFEETVPMSTYLVAFMISEFEYSEAESADSNITFRVWARKEALDQVELAKEIGPKVLSYFETYFDTPYPLPKQDMAAIPDFHSGAMENWGLITYREVALLYEPNTASISDKYEIASIISHELAHQWFGNLVTMKWWTDLWLNEGFATYVGELGVNHIFPEWNILDSSAIENFLTVLALDELKSSHPVSVPIGHSSEIEQIFDNISYEKGSYLIRMMNMFLGEDVFRRSISNYLQLHKYKNAEQDDLWEALTDTAHRTGILQSNLTVKMIMDTWTLQTGYPLITVTRNYDHNTVTITQKRYTLDKSAEKNRSSTTSESCWWIPLSFTSSSELQFIETKPKLWLTCAGPVTFHVEASNDEWLLFNIKASGLYRINYDEKNWKLLQNILHDEDEYNRVDSFSRVQIIADSLSLAWNGKLDYQMVFNLISYLRHETEYLPMKTALSALRYINEMLMRTSISGYFKKFVRHILEPSYERINIITNIPIEYEAIRHHTLITSSACYYGVLDCEDQTHDLFKEWYSQRNPDENNPIPNDLRNVVYCQAVKIGGEKYWEFLWQRYERSNVATEKEQILSSLGCVKELWLLQRYLHWSIDPSKIRKQDSVLVFRSVVFNEIGYEVAKGFFMKQFQSIHTYFGNKASSLGRYIKLICSQITTPEELNEFQSFTSSKLSQLKEAELSLNQGLESASKNIQWHAMHFDSLSNYFLSI